MKNSSLKNHFQRLPVWVRVILGAALVVVPVSIAFGPVFKEGLAFLAVLLILLGYGMYNCIKWNAGLAALPIVLVFAVMAIAGPVRKGMSAEVRARLPHFHWKSGLKWALAAGVVELVWVAVWVWFHANQYTPGFH